MQTNAKIPWYKGNLAAIKMRFECCVSSVSPSSERMSAKTVCHVETTVRTLMGSSCSAIPVREKRPTVVYNFQNFPAVSLREKKK